jgi:prepilin peptidase CpaA
MVVEGIMGVALICLLAVLLMPAAIIDMRTRRIPNWLSLAGMLLGIAIHTFYTGFSGSLESLAGLGVALVVGFLLFAIGWLGAGDAKLLAAVGAVVGLPHTLEFLFWIIMSGGLVAMVALAVRGVLPGMLKRWWVTLSLSLSSRRWALVPGTDEEAVAVPYAVSIALGSAVAVVMSRLWTV